MGGPGSGRRQSGKVRTVEMTPKIDIHAVARAVRRSTTPICTMTWILGPRSLSGVIAMLAESLVVQAGGRVLTARLVYQERPFGGVSPSLVCGSCAREVSTLFVADDRLQCRTCAGLRYRSQLEHPAGRARLRNMKALRRLGADDTSSPGIPPRRPGQWRRTYGRLLSRLLNAHQSSYSDLFDRLAKLKAKRQQHGGHGPLEGENR